MAYDNTNRGVLFQNDYKTADKHPDWKGKIDINGKEYELAAWKRAGRNGEFLSLSVSEPRERKREAAPELDDEIPF
jgi:hypothetical protein